MKTNVWIKSALGTLLLTAIFALLDLFFNRPQDLNTLLWGVVANFLIALILGYYIIHSRLIGLKLGIAVFLIYFFFGPFCTRSGAYTFYVTDKGGTTNKNF